jgi:hypothetical protein
MDYHYQAEAVFDDVPPNDDALIQWIHAQADVRAVRLSRQQVGDRWLIQLSLAVQGDALGPNARPDIDAAAAEFGYRGQHKLFRDMLMVGMLQPRE